MTDIATLQTELMAAIDSADTLDALEAVRISALGKQGSVSALLKTMGAMSPDERQTQGPIINGLRESVTAALAAKKAALETAELNRRLASEYVDMTLPAPETPRGTVHPVSQVMDELAEIFADMGFAVAEGREIEDDWHNFTALNIPETHPARAMHDTFYFPDEMARAGSKMLLRTHTSPVQIRTMTSQEPPIRIIAPGRVYRSDSDATHTPMFHQIEGLVIDKGIHLGHLKWTLETFLKAYFEREDVVLRLRPSYFPFTEPSVEVDVGYSMVNGKRVIGGSEGWMEVLGSGMVHRKVIEACGLDPDIWQGFAFGTGVDRLAMLKYGMDDLRAFFDGDNRWLQHYGFDALDVPTLSGGVGA
ncbi:MAG: phenylalanine--tRNA ligase subunit alpha [Sphingomonadales bacterium 35-56-22]|uniref:phenylalanine--tRNA ligase subunit alpha n=1 Tax=Sphingorhabdus sp. TaxID=1902408 RepID=UPI000BCFD6DC|nr:phenylalanine--tRNA ligase subunit alpha [Sphingorhabdus sp.]OYY15043.1 MAG: phenylalanine--tRNA ligase subunit alpha [Sphingomonadales bacterium 35-56-22]OYY96624.1 MAG: phenylalanine--tRNA ligase subunit alpha [Sphingomonadales bacterium 28-56-43]OYZ60013.1 MAG: phenylalanine--tRNA ligase subunit alpha [Sphingomonadales bacterium 24-56-14]OZA82190.1 MAG: phenylalanine--tRNA ligase subunit alpha [Sphingomonadales bacterium 39-57-19]HQS13358.1 phenylalanine--tRNA ligase subunit alpha [Sphin